MTTRKLLLILLILISAAAPLFAETDLLEVKIAFIGPADAVYSWWGHVAFIIENTASGAAKYYDYGNFSFDQDSFVRNFIMGRLYFLKMASNPDRQLKYNAYLNRDVTIYTLDISLDKKLALYRFLENDIRPENRIYLYDHFYDNCATRIRDEMDLITDGQFSAAYDVPSDRTLRMQLRRSSYSHPFMDWLLNFALYGDVDKPITELTGMYLPIELQSGVARLMLEDQDGNTRPFVKNVEIYNRAEGRAEVKDYPPPRWPYGLAVGMILAAAAWLFSRNSNVTATGRKAAAVFSAALSLTLAVPGSLLFFMAFFTDHYYTYWNANLLFVNPFLLVTLVFSIRLLLNRPGALTALRRCWFVTSAGAVISVLIKIIPLCRQDDWETVLLVLPEAAVITLMPSRSLRSIFTKQL